MVVLECLVLDIEDVKAYDRPCEISMTIFFSSFTSVCTDTRLKCTKANVKSISIASHSTKPKCDENASFYATHTRDVFENFHLSKMQGMQCFA